MPWLTRILRTVQSWLRPNARDGEMADEFAFHLAMERDEAIRAGATDSDAAAVARRSFGSVERFREEGREARAGRWRLELESDLRYALRVLRRAPGFAVTSILVLALGIGATTAMFSVVNAIILRPLPFPDAQQLLRVWDTGGSRAEFAAMRERVHALSSIAAYQDGVEFTVGGVGEPERVTGALVSGEFFHTLGVAPAVGQYFDTTSERHGSEPIVVLSDGLWRTRYGADRRIVGQSIEIDGALRRVVAVAPSGLRFPSSGTRLWVPLEINRSAQGPYWGAYGFDFVGRLRAGMSPRAAGDEVVGVARALVHENPLWTPDSIAYVGDVTVVPLQEAMVHGVRPALLLLLGAVGMVLLMACANVANLLVVRGATRVHELRVRVTLGADRGRLVRQLLTESLVLAVLGGAVGLAVAAGLTRMLVALLPGDTPRLDQVGLDLTAVAVTAAVAILCGVAFGLVPARRAARPEDAPEGNGARVTAGSRQRRLARLLVAFQVATGVVLVSGAGLMVRSLSHLLAVDPGFDLKHTVSVAMSVPRAKYSTREPFMAIMHDVLERANAAPGVIEGAAVTTQMPFESRNEVLAMWIDGWTVDPNKLDIFEIRRVTPDFFRTMGIPLKSGRGFLASDGQGSEPVAIVSQSAAAKFWAGRDPTKGRMRFPWPGWINVVGVVGDVHNGDLRSTPPATLYLPFDQSPGPNTTLVARTNGDPMRALRALTAAVRAAGPDVAISDAVPVRTIVDRSVGVPRALSAMLMSFGVLALVLGVVGTYGVIAFGVASRKKEFAVRAAVGADRRRVLSLVLREGASLIGGGLIVGVAASLALTGLLRGLLFEVTTRDPASLAFAPLLLGISALIACVVPAWRASRVPPLEALRADG